MTAKALVAVSMCVFLSLALHGCFGCDELKANECLKCSDAEFSETLPRCVDLDMTCEKFSACIKDNGCCDSEGEEMQADASQKYCALMPDTGLDACA